MKRAPAGALFYRLQLGPSLGLVYLKRKPARRLARFCFELAPFLRAPFPCKPGPRAAGRDPPPSCARVSYADRGALGAALVALGLNSRSCAVIARKPAPGRGPGRLITSWARRLVFVILGPGPWCLYPGSCALVFVSRPWCL